MSEFPASPLPPSEYLEQWFPAAYAEAPTPPGAADADVKLGVKLDGDGGGEWVFHLDRGAITVTPGSREETAFTLAMSADDWRGALWEARAGAIGQGIAAFFKPGTEPPQQAGPGGAPTAAALGEMEKLSGSIRMQVNEDGGGAWKVDFVLGPGPIPAEPTTTISVAGADAAAMATGELDPMQAFMAGKMQVTGDMTLMMQMQAIQMQAAAQAAKPPESGDGGAGGQGGGPAGGAGGYV